MIRNIIQSFITPLTKEWPFFIINYVFLTQSTLFSFREWSVNCVVIFFTSAIFYSCALTLFIFYSGFKFLKFLIYFFGITICTVNLFLYLKFSTRLSPNILQLLIETNCKESADFVTSYLMNWTCLLVSVFVLSVVMLIIALEKFNRDKICKISKYVIITFFFLFFIGTVSVIRFYDSLLKCTNTTEIDEWVDGFEAKAMDNFSNLVYSIYDIILMRKEISIAIESTDIKNKSMILQTDSINIVLIIGESFNKYHSSLYGYYLNTNPVLSSEKDKDRLFVFTNAMSFFNLTSKALRNMMSTNSVGMNESWANMPFFPAIFKQAGYNVFFWDNQYNPLSREGFDFSLNSYLHNPTIEKKSYSKSNLTTFSLDNELICDYINTLDNKEGPLSFSIFHFIGQHFSYYNRYPHPSAFDYFSSDSIRNGPHFLNKEMRQVISDYDNATRYNDFVVGNILHYFSERKAVVVYLADHGEEIFDYRSHYGRSWETPISPLVKKYQYEIPMIVWCSEKYKKHYPYKIEAIKESLDKPFSSDNICHLLFDLGCIETEYYNPSRDIINKAYKCPPIKYNMSTN